MRRLARIGLTVGTLGLALGCIADITGAPCETQDTCPLGQVCTAAKLCAPVSGLTGSGGGAGGGNPALAPIGSACATDAQCASGWCYTDNPGGECTSECTTDADCGAASTCVDEGDGYSTCYLKCTGAQGCRSGYQCSSGICLPQ